MNSLDIVEQSKDAALKRYKEGIGGAPTIFKVIEECEVKKVGERKYEFTASTATIDRDGESILATGWDLKNFKKNPVIMYAHDYRSLPIGKAPRVWVSDTDGVKKLKNTVEFPPEGTYEFADIVERLVDTGYLKTESVGFIPKEWEEGDGEKSPRRTYTKQELLEISIVPVPSNPDALMNAVKEGVITTKQLKQITEPEIEPEVKKPKEISQEDIKDEIDYLALMIDEVGLSDETEEAFRDLIKRLPTADTVVEIVNITPIAVDNTANDERLKLIIEQTVKNVIKEIK